MDFREVVPNTILIARQLRGVSQKELAAAIGVSQSILSRIEHGLLKPTSRELVSQMAEALKVKETFFYDRKELLSPISLVWRKKAALDAKQRDKVIAWAIARIYDIEKLLRDLEIETNVPRYQPGVDYETPEDIANALRRYWKVPRGPIENLTALVEQAGILVVHIDNEDRLIDGFALRDNRSLPIIFLNKNQSADRMRFSLAHELGHLIMHGWAGSGEEEQQADEFASAFLMPEQDIRRHLSEMNWSTIQNMKLYWKVSMAALIMRSASLGILHPTRKTSLFQQLSRKGWKVKEPIELEKEVPGLLKALIETHKQEVGLSSEELSDIMGLYLEEYNELYEPPTFPISKKLIPFPMVKSG